MALAKTALPPITGAQISAACGLPTDPPRVVIRTARDLARWEQHFATVNAENKKVGLPPRAYCVALYDDNSAFARTSTRCAAKVKAYESGHCSALDD